MDELRVTVATLPAGCDRRVHDMLARTQQELDGVDESDEPDEQTRALIQALAELTGEQVVIRAAAWDPAKHPRGPGGKFLSTVDRLKSALTKFLKGPGDGDPFEGFSREQLRKAAKARGLDVPKGASREHISGLLLADLSKNVKTPAAKKTPAKPKLFGQTDIGHIPVDRQKLIFASYKAQPKGQLLSSSAADSYDNLVAVAHVHGKHVTGLSAGQVAAIVDQQLADHQHLTNGHLLENKIRSWLQTADGADYARAHTTPDTKIVKSLTGQIDLPKGVVLKPGQKVQELGGPGAYKKTETDFPQMHTGAVQSALEQLQGGETQAVLTPDQYSALQNYTGGGYSGMNDYLRGKTTTPPAIVKQQVVQVQSAMVPLPHPVLLERGTGWEQLPDGFRSFTDAQKLVGKTIQEPAFMSTALAGSGGAFSGQVKLLIEAPKGTPGRYVKDLSLHPHEYELLLAAGTKFRVLAVTDNYGSVTIRLRVVTKK
jgi:hypothetical protein